MHASKSFAIVLYFLFTVITYLICMFQDIEGYKNISHIFIIHIWRNINNLRYADGTNLMADSKEELNSLLIKVKEGSEKADLKLHSRN